ncbi:hypothetical protein GCM10023259_029770 [Thermocatellispora tengchongensis]
MNVKVAPWSVWRAGSAKGSGQSGQVQWVRLSQPASTTCGQVSDPRHINDLGPGAGAQVPYCAGLPGDPDRHLARGAP